MSDSIFDTHKKQILKVIEDFPRKAAVVARRHFDENFTKKGFVDKGIKKWKPVKDHRKGSSGFKERPLVKTGRLRASFRTKVTPSKAVIFTDIPYAGIHNSGFDGTIKAHTRVSSKGNTFTVKAHQKIIPQRQFIGESKKLN